MRDDCTYDWYSGIGSILFDDDTQRKISNITKLASFFVKYNVDERWMKSLIEMNLNDMASQKIGETVYYESLRFRLGRQTEEEFDEILANTKFRS